jgi:hypothetical protein
LNAAPTVDLLNRLVGQGATISLGNKNGDVWTDLAKVITPPAIDMTRPGIAESSGANGRSVGALTDVRGTPWAMSCAGARLLPAHGAHRAGIRGLVGNWDSDRLGAYHDASP